MSEKALEYLRKQRNLTDETIEYFKLGYDKEKNAIVIPVFKNKELINLRYRYLDPKAKMKYSQEKGCEVWMYHEEGITIGKDKGGVLIVEGEFDLMSAYQAGFMNVISPASGKDSYGVWIELLDDIKKVYISYDNDKPGKQAGIDLATRIGMDKCFEINYPDGVKDANDYFKEHSSQSYTTLIKNARPFYRYTFNSLADVITELRTKRGTYMKLDSIPYLKMDKDWMIVLSADSNVGKTTYAMNIAEELVRKDIPTLVLPFERGNVSVGQRYLQVRFKKTQDQLIEEMSNEDWDKVIKDCVKLPLYFATPKVDETVEVIEKAKRLFGTRVVILDHLDYMIGTSDANNVNREVSKTLKKFKLMAQELGIIFIIIHHLKKEDDKGFAVKEPTMKSLKGASELYQDPEGLIMLTSPNPGKIKINILKNKGDMGFKIYDYDLATGVIDFDILGWQPPSDLEAQGKYNEL